jgi:hypothetical protein
MDYILLRAIPEITKRGVGQQLNFFWMGGRIFCIGFLSMVGFLKNCFSWVAGLFFFL